MNQRVIPLCVCGSGLSRTRCCDLNPASFGAPEAGQHLAPLGKRAIEALQQGDKATAERLAIDVLELAPGRIGALTVLYELRKGAGVQQAAQALIRRIVALDPNNVWAAREAGLSALARGDLAEAERHARNAVRLEPESAQSHYLLAMILTEAHRPAVGEFHYVRACELSGARDAAALANHGLCLKNQGKVEAARALYREALALAPDDLHTLLGLARLEEADRQLDAALALLDRVEALSPENPHARLLRAVVLGRQGEAEAALATIEALVGDRAALAPAEWLEKGRLLDKLGRYEEAFTAFDEGKKRLRELSGQAYLADAAAQAAARQRAFFVRRRLDSLPRAGVRTDVAQPLFVAGFPRSGTTLMEQALTAHPRIAAGDELPLIAELAGLMPRMLESPLGYPEALSQLWMGDHRDDLDILRDHYLRKAAQLGVGEPGAAWFTDKMPLNEFNLGLIHMIFPQAPVVHMVRHPLDVVVSVYSNLLTHGFYCAYTLESVAKHYVLTFELVEHYRREMDLRYLRVRYEDLVDDFEGSLRQVFAFVGEAFDARCLAFHENRRYARTASYAQVSERLYDRSRYRHRHYLLHLEPVLPILRPIAERLGYEV